MLYALQNGLFFGTVLSALMTLFIFTTLYLHPEIWIQDAPKDIQERFGPLSAKAKRTRTIWAIPLFVILILLIAWAIVTFSQQLDNALEFIPLFVMLFVMMMTFNIWDLFIIDWLIVVTIQPRWVMLPGTEGMAGYKDYGFHFRAFLKGTVGIFVACAVISAIAVQIV